MSVPFHVRLSAGGSQHLQGSDTETLRSQQPRASPRLCSPHVAAVATPRPTPRPPPVPPQPRRARHPRPAPPPRAPPPRQPGRPQPTRQRHPPLPPRRIPQPRRHLRQRRPHRRRLLLHRRHHRRPLPQARNIVAKDTAFQPSALSAPAGAGHRHPVESGRRRHPQHPLLWRRGQHRHDGPRARPGDALALTRVAPAGGTYSFKCDVHPQQMTGTLSVH